MQPGQSSGSKKGNITTQNLVPAGVATVGTAAATIASAAQGIRRIRCTGMLKARVTGLAAWTGTAVVSLVATN